MKKISAVIPVYNAENKIDRLLDSLNRQELFDKVEIIFVNDGSTDNSLQKINSFSKNKDNIIIINQSNSGVSNARNKGIASASGKYITFIDADDYLDDDCFKTYLELINLKYDLFINGYFTEKDNKIINIKKNKKTIMKGNEKIIKQFLLGTIDPNCWNKIFKTSILKKAKFDENLSFGEDKDLLFRYLKYCKNVYISDFVKYHYILFDNSLMRKCFNEKELLTVNKSEERVNTIRLLYPNLVDYAKSSDIDTKCRVLCNIYNFNQQNNYNDICKELKKDIRKYSFLKKKKFSTKKHFLGFVLTKISPKLYLFFKKNLKFQYK